MYNVKNILRELINKVVDLEDRMYPVGSIYMSVNNVNPSTYFGGTWIQWGSGKVPVGVDANETEFATVEQSGGEKTHTLATGQIPSHTHTYDKANANTNNHTLTTAQLPSHTHTYAKPNANTNGHTLTNGQLPKLSGQCEFRRWTTGGITAGANGIFSLDTANTVNTPCAAGSPNQSTTTRLNLSFGNGESHSHAIGTASTNSGGTGSGNAHSHGIGTTSTNSGGLSNAGNAHNNLQPYITCYMWKRTA